MIDNNPTSVKHPVRVGVELKTCSQIIQRAKNQFEFGNGNPLGLSVGNNLVGDGQNGNATTMARDNYSPQIFVLETDSDDQGVSSLSQEQQS